MTKIYSKINPNTLLHIVNKLEDINARTNVCPENQFIQLATLKMNNGQTFKAHKHIFKPGQKQVIAQESWIVIKGSVKVFFYDLDDTLLTTEVLNVGDCSITFEGGHNYLILEDDTIVYEYKTGPYTGQENDKVFIDDKN